MSTEPALAQDPEWLTEADLERAIGKRMVVELFSDRSDGRSQDVGAKIREALVDAERWVEGYLLGKAGNRSGLSELGRNDPNIRRQACLYAANAVSLTKHGFVSAEGTGKWHGAVEAFKKQLEAIQKSQQRSAAEEASGRGASIGGSSSPTVAPDTRSHIFAPHRRGGNPTSRF